MNIAKISVHRPIFTTCVCIAVLVVGLIAFKKLPVDLYPDINVPSVAVMTVYPGAGPREVETLVTKPLEDSLSNVAGLKKLTSKSIENVSQVTAEFNQGVDSKYAEQLVRDKVNQTKPKFPQEAKEPVISKIDLSALPILMVTLNGDLSEVELYELADQRIKPAIEQVDKVGAVEIVGGRKREVHVLLDRQKLKPKEMSVLRVATALAAAGENIPTGKVSTGTQDKVFRSLGEFKSTKDIENTVVNLFANETPLRVADLGTVVDTLEDEQFRLTLNGKKALGLQVYRQSGANTVEVAEAVKHKLDLLSKELASERGHPGLTTIIDGSQQIRDEVADVYETIAYAILFTVLTVFLFLGNLRSTLIIAISLPVSLVGVMALLNQYGFSINIVTLMAMSLAVGLLVDDAIVVLENIYRHLEAGENLVSACINGCSEIQISVVAISLVVISVFLPFAFMSGVVGQFLKQFGLTVSFAMAISLFVALTIVPMLMAYFIKRKEKAENSSILQALDRGQERLSIWYGRLLQVVLNRKATVLLIVATVFVASMATVIWVGKGFTPEADNGLLMVTIERPPGTNLNGTQEALNQVDRIVRSHPDVSLTVDIAGATMNRLPESNKAMIFVKLKDHGQRKVTTSQFKAWLREQLKTLRDSKPMVSNYDLSSGARGRPITINFMSNDADVLQKSVELLVAKMKTDPRLKDIETSLAAPRPEYQVRLNEEAARIYGVNTKTMGIELRGQVEGMTPAKFREKGQEYDVRVRLRPEQRDVEAHYGEIFIPNINYKLIRLANVAQGKQTTATTAIDRQNRARLIQVMADVGPGVGVGDVVASIDQYIKNELKLPPEVRYSYTGDSDLYREMIESMLAAFGLAVLFIFLILSSLYESFVTPVAILISLPLALCGAMLALFLTGAQLNVFALFGIFMLLGVAGKNSILLVDFILQRTKEGLSRNEAIVKAGRERLRPILMTSMALVAGAIPIAMGLNPASQLRTSMGIAIIGGMISSTLLTLLVVPVVYVYIDGLKIRAASTRARIVEKVKSLRGRRGQRELPLG